MQTVSVEIPRDALLQAVKQLNRHDLDHFVNDVLMLRAKRIAPTIKEQEADLLAQISMLGLNKSEQLRLHTLLEKAEAETLSDTERAELLKLSDKSERLNAKRISKIIQLAEIRQKPFTEVMQSLGLSNDAV
ncbi:MAG: hypothetical protein GY805_15835 [Chloroflexi bacterium]|nr:hypothetical protein [Chloroflexota bacterium]